MSNEAILIRRTPSTGISLPVATLRDTRLSFRARGVLALLLTYDNETLISTADLSSHGTEGRDALRTALAELREFSYVQQTRYPYQDDRGRSLWAWETVVSDAPLPSPENPSSVGSISPGNPSSVSDLVTTPSTRREKSNDTPELSTTTEDGFPGFLSCSTITTSSESVSRGTSYLPPAPPARATSEGWDAVPDGKPKRVSKSAQRAAAAKAEQESTDPFVALSDDEFVAELTLEAAVIRKQERATRVDQGRRDRVRAKRAERPVGPAAALADYFAMEATEPVPEEPAARFNAAAMAKNFAAWRRDGANDGHIRDMVDEYWHGSYRRNLAAPAWKDFISAQDKIHAQLERRFKAEEVEANRSNPEYWT